MKSNLTIKICGIAFSRWTKDPRISVRQRKAIHQEYRKIMHHAKDIGSTNQLLTAYAMAAWFIAMNRMDDLSPDENSEIMKAGMSRSNLLRVVLGDAEHNLNAKHVEKQKKWSEKTHLRKYENDWVVDVVCGNGAFDLGYDYWECGICKLCQDEGCRDLAKYLCQIDYLFAQIMGLTLERTTTLAEGGEKCDFRFRRKDFPEG